MRLWNWSCGVCKKGWDVGKRYGRKAVIGGALLIGGGAGMVADVPRAMAEEAPSIIPVIPIDFPQMVEDLLVLIGTNMTTVMLASLAIFGAVVCFQAIRKYMRGR